MLADEITYALRERRIRKTAPVILKKPESGSIQLMIVPPTKHFKIDFDFERYDIINRIRNVGLGKHATCNH